jgi:predicted dehydrogenase
MRTIKAAIFGTGFMGRVHAEAARRLGNVEITTIVGSSSAKARAFANSIGIERSTGNYREVLADPKVEVVHVCTPNNLHFAMAVDALNAGKHVVCEKPLATSIKDGEQLVALAKQRGLRNCTFHNIRFYPQVQNMRRIIQGGEIGEIWVVQGTYSQDWLLYDTDWNWRIEAEPSRTFADIGTHWSDLAEHVTGLKFVSVCCRLCTFHKFRKKPSESVETFATSAGGRVDYKTVQIRTEDFGAMMFQMGDVATGVMTASQISAGRKNRVFIEIFGSKGSVAWNAERHEELWMGHRGVPNQIVMKEEGQLRSPSQTYVDLPPGHSEGYDDTFKQLLRRFYASVIDKDALIEYPTFEDGVRQLKILDAVINSAGKNTWVNVPN